MGEILFYSGLAGMAVVVVAAIVIIVNMTIGKKKLTCELDKEYGAERDDRNLHN